MSLKTTATLDSHKYLEDPFLETTEAPVSIPTHANLQTHQTPTITRGSHPSVIDDVAYLFRADDDDVQLLPPPNPQLLPECSAGTYPEPYPELHTRNRLPFRLYLLLLIFFLLLSVPNSSPL